MATLTELQQILAMQEQTPLGQVAQPPQQGFLERFNVLPLIGGIGGFLGGGPLGGAAGAGGGELLEQFLFRRPRGEGFNLPGLATEAALGGLAPVVAGKAISALGKTGIGLQKFSTGIKPGTVGKGIGAATKEADVLKTIQAFTKPGAAQAKREVLQPTVDTLNKAVGKLISKKSADAPTVRTFIEKSLSGFTDEPFLAPKNQLIQQLEQKVINNKIPGKALDILRVEAGKQLAGTSPKAIVNRGFYGGLRDAINDLSEEAGQLLSQQANLFAGAPALTKAAQSSLRLPLIGVNLPGMGAVQTGADIAGRGAQVGAEALSRIPRGAGVAAAQAGTRLPSLLPTATSTPTETTTPPPEQPSGVPGVSGIGGAEALPSETPTQQAEASPLGLTKEQLIMAMLADPQNLNVYKSIYQLINADQKKTQAASSSEEFINKANFTMSQIEGADKLGYGPAKGRLYDFQLDRLGGAGVPNEVIALGQKYKILKLNVLRAYQGARISDKDFELASQYIPSLSDTSTTAKTKLDVLKQLLQNAPIPGPGEWTGAAAGGTPQQLPQAQPTAPSTLDQFAGEQGSLGGF